ncbi:MAG: WecB/TagA/CpsF family glycosyltransferase [Pirellulales bacterium]|nr:WecB/TagA/CpsF family glycosyltransferase [Pirellulales bacterium]
MSQTQVIDFEPTPASPPELAEPLAPPTVTVWGLPLARIDMDDLVDCVDRLVERRRPSFFITANLHYARLCRADRTLQDVNRRAAFLVADGMPLVWYSWLLRRPLPARVTGADAVYRLCQRAAERGHRVFLLGAAPEVARRAADILRGLFPGLNVVGVRSPAFAALSPDDHEQLVDEIRRTEPDVLFVALGQPKGERWLARHVEALGVPACVQVGAALDFIAGRVHRAPRWARRLGVEWLFRAVGEPRRLVPRYAADAAFLAGALARDLSTAVRGLWRKKQ